MRRRVAALDWDDAARDVASFPEPGHATDVFGRESLLSVLK